MARLTKSVLLVDDNPIIRRTLHRVFESQADFDVCGEAENGQEAIEKASQLSPDVIVLDLSMPVMNGLDAARVLKQMAPTVPLILFSSFTDALQHEMAETAGFSAVISKADNVSVLIDKTRHLLQMPDRH